MKVNILKKSLHELEKIFFFSVFVILFPLLSHNAAVAGSKIADSTEKINYAYAISSNRWDAKPESPQIEEYKKIARECENVGNTICTAAAEYNIGTVLYQQESYLSAIPYYKKALTKFETLGDNDNIKLVLYNLVAAYIKSYNISQDSAIINLNYGEKYCKELLNISLSTGDAENMLDAYNFRGIINIYKRNYYIALESYEKILEFYVANRIVEGKGKILNNIAAIYYYLGDYKKALSNLQSAAIVYMINEKYAQMADVKNNIAIIYAETGDYETAQAALYKLEQGISEKDPDCTIFNSLGVIYTELCEFEKALKYYNKSLKKAQSLNMGVEVAKNLKDIGTVYEEIGEYKYAVDYYKEALQMSDNINDYTNITALNLSLGNIYSKDEIYSLAQYYYENALKLAQMIEDRKMEAFALFNIGNVYSHQGEYEKALEYYYSSFNLYRGLGIKKGQGIVLVNISDTHNKLKNFDKGKKYALHAIDILNEINYLKHLKVAYLSLADAYKGDGDLLSAETFMNKAREYDIICAKN